MAGKQKKHVDLSACSMAELTQIARILKVRGDFESKREAIDAIALKTEKKKRAPKYKTLEQLGKKGKEARTFLVQDKFGCTYAMKTYRSNKSSDKLLEEVEFQMECSAHGISPKIIDFSAEDKYIVMEKMDGHLFDEDAVAIEPLTENQQRDILRIFRTLDKVNVFHGDANILNYMLCKGRVYIIDFGYAERITDKLKKRLGTKTPNMEVMLVGFILKLRGCGYCAKSYNILRMSLSPEKRAQYGI